MIKVIKLLIDHLASVVAKARMRAQWLQGFPKLSKLLSKRGALSAPCSPQAPSRGARKAADGLDPSLLMSHYGLLHPTHHADKR